MYFYIFKYFLKNFIITGSQLTHFHILRDYYKIYLKIFLPNIKDKYFFH